MGFRFKRIDLVGGSTDFPTGSSSNVYRSQIIVKKVAESLIGMGNGWSLDTSRNATIWGNKHLRIIIEVK